MARLELVRCRNCGCSVAKSAHEVARAKKLGRQLYCSLSCVAKWSNRRKKAPTVVKTCPHCGNSFTSTTKAKAARFCSRSCASAGSMTPYRRDRQRRSGLKHKGNLIGLDALLKKREGWKYEKLARKLTRQKRAFEFEFKLGPYVHEEPGVRATDRKKDRYAKNRGYLVVRVSVLAGCAIPASALPGKRQTASA